MVVIHVDAAQQTNFNARVNAHEFGFYWSTSALAKTFTWFICRREVEYLVILLRKE